MLSVNTTLNSPDSLKRGAEDSLGGNVQKKGKTDTTSQKIDELVKTIDLSFLYPNCTIPFDLNQTEHTTKKTYKTLIEERCASTPQTPYVFSLVNDDKDNRLYDLDAGSVLPILKNSNTHPVTANKIRTVYLFTIGSLSEEFKYLGLIKQSEIDAQKTRAFIQSCHKSASGDPEGLYELAKYKIYNRSTQDVPEEALELLMMAAKGMSTAAFNELVTLSLFAGNIQATKYTALCHQYGYGTEVNLQAAQDIYKQLGETNYPKDSEAIKAPVNKENPIAKPTIDLPLKNHPKDPEANKASANEKNSTVPTFIDLTLEKESSEAGIKTIPFNFTNPNPITINQPITQNIETLFEGAKQGHDLAFKALSEHADSNDSDAQFYMGVCAESESIEVAIKWYARAARQSHLNAFNRLLAFAREGHAFAQSEAECCEKLGFGSPQGRKIAYNSYVKLAKSGDVEGQYWTGYFFEKGIGTQMDVSEAAFWYAKASNQNHSEAFKALNRLALRGNANALKYIELYKENEHATKNAEKTLETSNSPRQSLNINPNQQPQPSALNQIHTLNHIGINEIDTLTYVTKAARGDKDAFNTLLIYAESGNAEAQYNVGLCQQNGYGTTLSIENAIQWYANAAKKKHIQAFNNLLSLAEKGYSSAQNKAAYCKTYGLGTHLDRKDAYSLYLKSATSGDAEGQYNQGYFVETGLSVKPNIERAVDLYIKSASANHSKAFEALERLAEKGNIKAKDYIQKTQQEK